MNKLTKRSGEHRLYTMDLSQQPELVAGDTVASVTSVVCIHARGRGTSTADLTIANEAVTEDATGAECTIAGGVDGGEYRIAFTVVTTNGSILEDVGHLLVDDT